MAMAMCVCVSTMTITFWRKQSPCDGGAASGGHGGGVGGGGSFRWVLGTHKIRTTPSTVRRRRRPRLIFAKNTYYIFIVCVYAHILYLELANS